MLALSVGAGTCCTELAAEFAWLIMDASFDGFCNGFVKLH